MRQITEEVLGNTLEYSDEVAGTAFGEKQIDTGGVEPDAYNGALFADWDEAIRTMNLPTDDDTYRRYVYVRHRQLFKKRLNNFGEIVTSETRIPPRLTPEENLRIVDCVKRDMGVVARGDALMKPNGSLEYEVWRSITPSQPTPSDTSATLAAPPRGRMLPSDVFGVPDSAAPEYRHIERSRSKLPSDRLPDAPARSGTDGSSSQGIRPMRPDDTFGTPGTRIYRNNLDPAEVFRSAIAPRGAPTPPSYSLSIRPGETKTQVIELPGLTLELVITMPGPYPRVA
jgi:hypothetical protein